MSTYNLTQTEGYFVRANYDDGDVFDRAGYADTARAIKSEAGCRAEAIEASKQLRATVDACKGATVIASFRGGKEIA